MARHEILGGLVQVYKRGGRYWNCSASIDGHQHRATTKKDDLSLAQEFAEDWYLGLRGKARAGLLKTEKTFTQAADRFEKEYAVITEGQRSPHQAASAPLLRNAVTDFHYLFLAGLPAHWVNYQGGPRRTHTPRPPAQRDIIA